MQEPILPNEPQQKPWHKQLFHTLIRWLITTLAIFAAVLLVPGMHFTGPGWQLGIIAAVFGGVNMLIRPLLTLLTCPLILLTFGLFGLVLNAVFLIITAQIAGSFGLQFTIDGFWSALLGGLIISVITTLLNILSGETPVVVVRQVK
ncbi:phage holin family protein [Chloroflexia bacterium SDU3-3]|nr:phage holin family protein [Chloroflexia bacterium SDU3-3]